MTNSEFRTMKTIGYDWRIDPAERTYPVIDGVAYVDVFTAEDNNGGKYSFNGDHNAEYYNQIVVDDCNDTVTLTLDWGSNQFECDIKPMIDWYDANPASKLLSGAGVKSKKIEDYSVTKGTAEETIADIQTSMIEAFGYFIRRPLIVSIAGDQRDAGRYF